MTLLVVALLAGAAGGGWYGWRSWQQRAEPACAGTLTVATAPEVTEPVKALAAQWNAERTPIHGSCVRVVVSQVAPADMAAAIAGAHNTPVSGLGQANGATTAMTSRVIRKRKPADRCGRRCCPLTAPHVPGWRRKHQVCPEI